MVLHEDEGMITTEQLVACGCFFIPTGSIETGIVERGELLEISHKKGVTVGVYGIPFSLFIGKMHGIKGYPPLKVGSPCISPGVTCCSDPAP